MKGRVPASYGSWFGTGADQRCDPLGQTTFFLLSLVANRNGMLFANVRAGFIRSSYGEPWVWSFLCFLASLWCLVHLGSPSFDGLPFVYKTWVTLVCLLLDTSLGRRLVGTLPL